MSKPINYKENSDLIDAFILGMQILVNNHQPTNFKKGGIVLGEVHQDETIIQKRSAKINFKES